MWVEYREEGEEVYNNREEDRKKDKSRKSRGRNGRKVKRRAQSEKYV